MPKTQRINSDQLRLTRRKTQRWAPQLPLLGNGLDSNALEDLFFRHTLVRSNRRENRVQRPDPQRRVRRNSDPMRHRLLCLQNDVAPNLMDPLISPSLAKVV